MSMLAFLPWMRIREPISVGEFELFPYMRGMQPAGEGQDLQSTIDLVLDAYYDGAEKLREATIVRIDKGEFTKDLNESERAALFVLSELMSVSGISVREYFGIGFNYQNRDNFRLIIQGFMQPGSAAIVSRRRDGTSTNLVIGGAYHVQMPEHVRCSIPNHLDAPLLAALFEARSAEQWERLYDAIVSFNLANTDSSEMSEHIESVLLMSAFERLLDSRRGKEEDVAHLFAESLTPEFDIAPRDCAIIAADERYKAYATVREAWMRDFFRLRGSYAHGRIDSSFASAWSLRNHLLLASFVFPLALKRELSKEGLYDVTETDTEHINCFEALACKDHFLPHKELIQRGKYPWDEIMKLVMEKMLRRRMLEALKDSGSEPEGPND